MVTADELKTYLDVYRTRADISRYFKLSNSESWHLLKFYVKGRYVECKDVTGIATHKRGIIKLYKWCETDEDEISNNDT